MRSTRAGLAKTRQIRQVPHAILGEDARAFLPRFPDLIQNLPELEDAAAGRGVFSVRPDADGIYRRVPMAMLVQDELRLGLAPELLRVATGGNAFALRGNAAGVDGVVLGGKLVRTIGIARARTKIGMMNLVYNMRRLVWLARNRTPAAA